MGNARSPVLEIISPAGLERLFEAAGRARRASGSEDEVARGQNEPAARFGTEFEP